MAIRVLVALENVSSMDDDDDRGHSARRGRRALLHGDRGRPALAAGDARGLSGGDGVPLAGGLTHDDLGAGPVEPQHIAVDDLAGDDKAGRNMQDIRRASLLSRFQ